MSRNFFFIAWAMPEYWCLVLTGLIVGAVLLIWRWRKTRLFAASLTSTKWQSVLLHNFSRTRYIIKSVLLWFGLLGLLIALMGPMWNKKEHAVEQEGRDVLIALDVSRSMLAADVKPNRLEQAKSKIKKMLARLDAERVGLILFSGSAFVHCPLTTDFHAFNLFLDQVDAQTISSGTTAAEQAIARALEVFEAMPEKKTKLLILMTDGEDFSDDLSAIKGRAQKAGMHIFTMGVATTQGAPVPMYDRTGKRTGYIYDEKNNVVISKLNEELMRSLAQGVGGIYVPVAQDDADLAMVVRHIQRFEKESFDNTHVQGLESQYHYFAALSFVCMALEWVL